MLFFQPIALSRLPTTQESVFAGVSICQPLLLEQLRSFYTSNPIVMTLLQKFDQPGTESTPFKVQQGLLYFRDRLFIPLESDLRPNLIQEFHSTPEGGHSGNKGTLARLTAMFSWPNMARDIREFIRTCTVCNINTQPTNLMDCYNPYLFRNEFGKI